ncbi:MAG TPA: type VI secretion system baseplate subunit TssF [Pseudomonas sp.]|nr:type VI secretion system baseplate subunit TssF [Pseudomonas sp.]
MNKDNRTLEYFDAEMRYLLEAAREFAKDFPEIAAQLNLDKPGAPDASVEQLFQGFAFLMGRFREKLDDDFPELTESLVGMMWPQYLRCIPSLSIVELVSDIQQMKRSELIAAGLEVMSQPIGPQGPRCRYTTTQDLMLQPLAMETVQVDQEPNGRSLLRLRFACGAKCDWNEIDLSRLPLYLNADAPLASALHQALTLNTEAMYVRLPGDSQRHPLEGYFAAKGFAEEDRLWPKGGGEYSDYQLMLEYFTFREKFMFVRLCGLEKRTFTPGTPWFEVEVVLSEPWPHEFKPKAEHIRLNAVPVINLFAVKAEPLSLDPLQTEYRLRGASLQDGHTEIYSVDQVSASKNTARHDYEPFSSFSHKGGMLRHDEPERYFHTRMKRGPSGRNETWLILGGEGFKADALGENPSLSLRMTGTNGQLPRMALQSILLDTLAQASKTGLRVRNLCPPTLPCYPPNRDRFHWRILSHLGSNFLPMLDNGEVLRGTLSLYEWTGSELNQRRLAAITKVNHFLIERFEKGFLLRGVDIEVTLDTSGFCGDGDVILFGEMLNRFFALYADIHLFNQLTVILQPSKKCLRWDENHSQRIPG